MVTALYLDEVLELGMTLKRLGPEWKKYLPLARELYAAVRGGKATEGQLHHAKFLRDILQLGATPMAVSHLCPECAPQPGEPWSGVRTVYAFPDRHTCQCARCSTEWLVMDRTE